MPVLRITSQAAGDAPTGFGKILPGINDAITLPCARVAWFRPPDVVPLHKVGRF
ncbi:phosphoribosylaminoimidazole carboxylase, ATPase subunit [Anopheles sinensis]|uniref:Phosphoribosylaminoimidazole carboxylase, ATPase subunit n=1 Tax=Anopheles sinensis TaxID=74873 RepID=A0A084WDQ5_ANOSI|nr:phosphoribosylaminoimidazole carboxylase, ATPase subunit [Anopheles sinensis]